NLTDAAWGKPLDNGLRCAWLPEPSVPEYPVGSRMDTRILLHNSGKEPVAVATQFCHWFDSFTGYNKAGERIKVVRGVAAGAMEGGIFLLNPDQYCEVEGLPVSSIDAKAGEEVTVTISVYNDTNRAAHSDAPSWEKIVRERVEREGPMP